MSVRIKGWHTVRGWGQEEEGWARAGAGGNEQIVCGEDGAVGKQPGRTPISGERESGQQVWAVCELGPVGRAVGV